MVKVIKKMKWLIIFFNSTLKVALWSALNIQFSSGLMMALVLMKKTKDKVVADNLDKKERWPRRNINHSLCQIDIIPNRWEQKSHEKLPCIQTTTTTNYILAPIKFPSGHPKWVRRRGTSEAEAYLYVFID